MQGLCCSKVKCVCSCVHFCVFLSKVGHRGFARLYHEDANQVAFSGWQFLVSLISSVSRRVSPLEALKPIFSFERLTDRPTADSCTLRHS